MEKHRLATLNGEFRRDLHLRQFRAFASLGFDDTGWLSDEDLSSLEKFANKDIADANARLSEANLESEKQGMRGRQAKTKLVEDAQKHLDAINEKLAPLLAEIERRKEAT